MPNEEVLSLLVQARAAIDGATKLINAPPDIMTRYAWAFTDRLARPKPPLLAIGPAGSGFVDPTFGSRHLRLTGKDGEASWTVPSNAHQAAFNADSTALFVMGNAGKLIYKLDRKNFAVFPGAQPVNSQPEPQFSRVDPDSMFVGYGAIGRTLQRYSLSKQTYTNILDLDSLGLPLANPRTYIGGICSSAAPEVLATFFGGQQADQHHYVLVMYLNGTSHLIDTMTDPRLPHFLLHSISIDLSGRFIILYPTASLSPAIAKKIVWDMLLDKFTLLPEGSARMGGHDALGYGTMVNMEGASFAQPYDAAQWVLRKLDDPLGMMDLIRPVLTPLENGLEDHTNWNAAQLDRATPVFSSTFFSGTQTAPWRPWNDEIIGIDTFSMLNLTYQGPGATVYRFAHHRSSRGPFWSQPILITSPDGCYGIYTSNREGTLGLDPQNVLREDVFLIELGR